MRPVCQRGHGPASRLASNFAGPGPRKNRCAQDWCTQGLACMEVPMEADGVPGSAEPVPAEIVHESGRTRVPRLLVPGGTVIRKEPLGPDAERRLRHEVAMLERLSGVSGVAQLGQAEQYPGSVLLADAGDITLAGAVKPVAAGELAGLAAGLGRAVAGMHQRGVVHRDISPANV